MLGSTDEQQPDLPPLPELRPATQPTGLLSLGANACTRFLLLHFTVSYSAVSPSGSRAAGVIVHTGLRGWRVAGGKARFWHSTPV